MKITQVSEASRALFFGCDDAAERRALFKRHVANVIVELFDHCNRQCPYCPVSMADRMSAINRMSGENFAKIVRDLEAIGFEESVCLNLFNEPLSDESTFEAIVTLRKALPKATIWFNSNGDYVSREVLDRLASVGLNRIVITLHMAKGDVYRDLKQLTRISQFSARTGVILSFEKFKPDHAIVTSGRHKGIVIRVKSANYERMGENRAGVMTQIPVEALRSTPCDRPFHDLTIAWNGNVYPCCQFFPDLRQHDSFIAGNLSGCDTLYDLYFSALLNSFRRDLFGYGAKMAPCDTCTECDTHRGAHDERIRAAKIAELGLNEAASA